MQRRGLPPAHPSLPAVPILTTTLNNASTFFIPNPYPRVSSSQFQPAYSSHYAQAYLKSSIGSWSPTTVQSYTLSSTYDPSMSSSSPAAYSTGSNYPPRNVKPGVKDCGSQSFNHQSSSNWYQSGDSRCTYKACSFSGSQKVVEMHMIDRHLIYPPGWENRTKRSDWDADPSLKGKPIPIQGTTIILDTPEVLEAWIAERKKRWPSTSRVEEKKRKLEEAVARGQLSMDDSGLHGMKRRRMNESTTEGRQMGYRNGEDNKRGKGRGRGRGTDSGWRGRGRRAETTTHSRDAIESSSAAKAAHITQSVVQNDVANSDSSSDDDDGEPEAISSKPLLGSISGAISLHAGRWDTANLGMEGGGCDENGVPELSQDAKRQTLKLFKKVSQQQPKKLPRNPFASRPTLLRNLLLPEIRMTISNLSQAARFLVDNDFLDGVELKPGEGAEQMIEVIGSLMEGKERKPLEESAFP